MLSVFQKHLKKELGWQRYEKYCTSFERYKLNKSTKNRLESSQEVYQDLYDYLKEEENSVLHEKMETLVESMCEAVNISKYYIVAFGFYLAGALFLIFQRMDPPVVIVSLLLMSILFLYKTCEFVANKYCYIDANIILVYKSVLDQLLKSQPQMNESDIK